MSLFTSLRCFRQSLKLNIFFLMRSSCLSDIAARPDETISIDSTLKVSPPPAPSSPAVPTPSPSPPTALIVFANGSEVLEVVCTADVLRRAGVDVTLADLAGLSSIACTHKIRIIPEKSFCASYEKKYDAVILSGGESGIKSMIASVELGGVLRKQEQDRKLIAALGDAPTALQAHGVGIGKKITCDPSVQDKLQFDYNIKNKNIVIDGKLLTCKSSGQALQLGLQLANLIVGKQKASEVAKSIAIELDPLEK